jgi:DNA-binding protein HU-beta
MNKRELIDRVTETSGSPKGEVEGVVDALIEELSGALAKGDSVALPGFGSFEVRDRAARTGRNPQTGEELQIAASKAPAFKPASALKQRVNG